MADGPWNTNLPTIRSGTSSPASFTSRTSCFGSGAPTDTIRIAARSSARAVESVRVHRLRAVERAAPGREIESLQRRLGNPAHAQLVREVGRRREGGTSL